MSVRPQEQPRFRSSVRTPEGLAIELRIALYSERLVAAVLDLLVVGIAAFLVSVTTGMLVGPAIIYLAQFFALHVYFLWFETRGNGATLGKRLLHLRVVRADGGPLSVEVLLARNLTRVVEFILPVQILMTPDALFPEHHGVVRLVASLWILLPMIVPYLHPERMRIGDMLAGTRVVVAPPVEMLVDLADAESAQQALPKPKRGALQGDAFRFDERQLSIYGEHELSLLDELLRKADLPGVGRAVRKTATSIVRKIGFADVQAVKGNELEFLRAFYAAQREHLERRLLLGERRRDKHGGAEPPAS